jgi:DnaK suppressor protein
LNEEELRAQEALLKERKEQILSNLDNSKKELDGLNGVEIRDEADFASINSDKIREDAISQQQRQELNEISYALSKIENSTYGICEMCEEDVGRERIKVKPHAKYCIVCREIVEKSKQ